MTKYSATCERGPSSSTTTSRHFILSATWAASTAVSRAEAWAVVCSVFVLVMRILTAAVSRRLMFRRAALRDYTNERGRNPKGPAVSDLLGRRRRHQRIRPGQ